MNTSLRKLEVRERQIEVQSAGRRERGGTPAKVHKSAEGVQRLIRDRAYELYRARTKNGAAGDAVSDWLQAEHEINGAASPGD